MKKYLFLLVAALMAMPTFAQTDKEAEKAAKEAAKAEKAAQKAAEKEANGLLSTGIKLQTEARALYQENLTEMSKGDKRNQDLIDKNTQAIHDKSLQALDALTKANETGLISEKKFFSMFYAMKDVSEFLFNPEITLAAKREAFDTTLLARSLKSACVGTNGVLTYGKPNDEMQKDAYNDAKGKMPRLFVYGSYLCIFYTQGKNLDGMMQSLEEYANFAKNYPKAADFPEVKNPETPVAQLAYNTYLIAFNQKRFDICDKYYDLAMSYDDPEAHGFIIQSRPQIALQQGDTVKWSNIMVEMTKSDNAEVAETATQNLLAYYSKKGPEAMGKFADELLAANPENKMANYGKGYSLYVQNKYEEALPYYQKSIEIDPDYMEGNFQAGSCYYNIGKENYLKISDKKYKNQAEADKDADVKVKAYFRKAIPYFEKVRELVPEEPNRWAYELRTIYTNLGMKEQAAELPEM